MSCRSFRSLPCTKRWVVSLFVLPGFLAMAAFGEADRVYVKGPDGKLSVATAGGLAGGNDIVGGRGGGLLALANDILPSIRSDLDALAAEIVGGINHLHTQGVGLTGSFTELTGTAVGAGELDTWPLPVAAGSFFVRVIDTATGEITRTEIAVDPAAGQP